MFSESFSREGKERNENVNISWTSKNNRTRKTVLTLENRHLRFALPLITGDWVRERES